MFVYMHVPNINGDGLAYVEWHNYVWNARIFPFTSDIKCTLGFVRANKRVVFVA